jgi:probable HAF family extracellular repeat protein
MNAMIRSTGTRTAARARRWPGVFAAAWLVMIASQAPAQLAVAPLHGARTFEGYAVDFVSTAAFGVAMNDHGDVTGTSYPDTGCGSFCLPPLETVVWRGGDRIVLPSIPGRTGITVTDINDHGWVVGYAGFPGTTTHAVLWKPSGATYEAKDLGTLPGTSISIAVAIDELGRVIGWSQTSNFPPTGSPFLWTESGGLVDLGSLGYPDEAPVGMSPHGTVATAAHWYELGDPTSVVALAPPPSGYAISTAAAAISDRGDQARFLVAVSGQHLSYLYRYYHEGTWQQLSSAGTGHLSRYGIGSINETRDVTATIASTGVVAYGPTGLAQSLASLVSPAYPGADVIAGGPMNVAGEILAQVMIGRSPRVVRLAPDHGCAGGCLVVTDLAISSDFVPDPNDPTHDHCSQGSLAHDETVVSVTVRNSVGAPVPGVLVTGRFLDDYWTDHPVSGMTDLLGVVTFEYEGPCGVGANAFLVDDAAKGALILDRGAGVLTGWAIPQ